MSSEEFKCIFCKETFDDKETLQIHFRKHGDLNFHLNKGRSQDEPLALQDKPASKDAEMVECDVCPEVFTSISKAITHKHKIHPDHDAKYFCPWCGKLFTMKHLYNKHISTTHKEDTKGDHKSLPCDSCSVHFNNLVAVTYHNKFFHRVQELPSIGNSKKLKMIDQEAVQIYYCPFCGEEYENKVNLHKHMADDHHDENQHPDDVLRCPVCDAIFYHLDAYELHLTYHSIYDLYSERSEVTDTITDFSLESVPPIAEKVENFDTPGYEEREGMGIEQLFELTMDSDTKHKKKKHKKHKKSKKSAITLDQFLNMNKDVFGEGIDFQGIEEVPSQVVAKRLKKPIKKQGQPSKLPSDIEKLKRQGIVVKKKSGTMMNAKPLMANTIINKISNPTSQTKQSSIDTPNDVLSKLINQNNSQIKIVKKSAIRSKSAREDTSETKQELITPTIETKTSAPDNPESNAMQFTDKDKRCKIHDTKNTNEHESDEAYPNNATEKSPVVTMNPDENSKCSDHNDDEDSNHSQSILHETDENEKIQQRTAKVSKNEDKLNALRNNSSIVIKSPIQKNLSHDKKSEEEISHYDEGYSKSGDNAEQGMKDDNKDNSLHVLKHLSHLIVKPVTHDKKLTSNEVVNVDKKADQSDVNKIAHLLRNSPSKMAKNSTMVSNTAIPLPDAPLKVTKSKESKDVIDDETNITSNEKDTEVVPESKLANVQESKLANQESQLTNIQENKLANILNNPNLNIQTIKKTSKVVAQKVSPSENLPSNEKSNTDLLKHLKNVTAKPVSVNKTLNVTFSPPNSSPKPVTVNTIKKEPTTSPVPNSKVMENDIEVFNIDDSDDDDEANSSIAQNDTNKLDLLKNINKNITIKSVNNHANVPDKSIGKETEKAVTREFDSNSVNDTPNNEIKRSPMSANSRNLKFSPQINKTKSPMSNVLKNLGKNITIKSGNTSPHFMPEDQHSQDSHFSNDISEESDTDTALGRVKITEMESSDEELCEEHVDNDKRQENVKVQYPDESNSENEEVNDHEEFDENFSNVDIEAQIAATSVKKISGISMPKQHSDSLKNVGKAMVLKPPVQAMNKISQQPVSSDEIPAFAKSLSNQISIRNIKQLDNKHVNASNSNSNNVGQAVSRATNKSAINQKITSSNKVNTKEVRTVKTIQTQSQTKTVIQEITTTVTKTIKTVNQSMKQEVRNTSQSSFTPKKIQQTNTNNTNFQGVKVRHSSPMVGPRIRNPGMTPTRPGLAAPVRPSNQLVPVRPRFSGPRLNNPRLPNVRPSTSGNPRPQIGAPVKVAPGVVTTIAKRLNTDDAPGHFSCFKKPKESLFPEPNLSPMKQDGDSVQFASAVHMSKSNYACTTKTVKGNNAVTSTQLKSEMSASSQQLNKLRNMSGLSVVKTSQAHQSHTEEKSEVNASKRNAGTLEAIQKLQNQGLLVKKPRLAISEENEHLNQSSDHTESFSDEECDS